jgi:glycosyltransferase involved in cell wall biosynthesis
MNGEIRVSPFLFSDLFLKIYYIYNMSKNNLLTLVMILKNEAHTIEKTLNSVKDHIDYWAIIDTGSTDGTQDIIRKCLENVPGQLHEEPFIDFSTMRNKSLDLAGEASRWIIWLDADDVLVGGENLRKFLEADSSGATAYYVTLNTGIFYDQCRVIKSGAGWRFKGVVHEVLMHPTEMPHSTKIPGVLVEHHPDQIGRDKTVARWSRDVVLLAEEFEKNPTDARSAFYLAQTLSWLGRWDEAYAAYRRRIFLEGWWEEVYESKMGLAKCAEQLGKSLDEVIRLFMDAYNYAPSRAEPLYEAAFRCMVADRRPEAFMYAKRGTEICKPTNVRLAMDSSIYDWRLHDVVASTAGWVGCLDVGEKSAAIAVKHNSTDDRMVKNLIWYIKKKN